VQAPTVFDSEPLRKDKSLTPEWLSAIASVGSTIFVPASIYFAARQWRESARAIRANTYQGINTQLQGIDLIFVENPELRPYFYAGEDIPQDKRERDRVMAVAELLVDFMDNVVTHGDAMPPEHREVWYRYFREQHDSSPAIRAYWSENSHWYRKELHTALSR